LNGCLSLIVNQYVTATVQIMPAFNEHKMFVSSEFLFRPSHDVEHGRATRFNQRQDGNISKLQLGQDPGKKTKICYQSLGFI
jgi:hypothetical protein